mgnify:CR=1 FL=1
MLDIKLNDKDGHHYVMGVKDISCMDLWAYVAFVVDIP